MKNISSWVPTNFIYDKKNQLIANKDYVSESSYIVATQAAGYYNKYIQEFSTGVLLDLGCGTVPLYQVYKDQVNKVICIDWGQTLHKNIHLDYLADLNSKIPLENQSIDTVILTDVIEHISRPRILMAEVSRVLRKGGKLILGVPFLYNIHEEPFDYHRYTKFQLKKLCDENLLKPIRIEETAGAITVLLDIIGKNLKCRIIFKLFYAVAVWFIFSKLGKALDSKTKKRFPRSYCLVAEKI